MLIQRATNSIVWSWCLCKLFNLLTGDLSRITLKRERCCYIPHAKVNNYTIIEVRKCLTGLPYLLYNTVIDLSCAYNTYACMYNAYFVYNEKKNWNGHTVSKWHRTQRSVFRKAAASNTPVFTYITPNKYHNVISITFQSKREEYAKYSATISSWKLQKDIPSPNFGNKLR